MAEAMSYEEARAAYHGYCIYASLMQVDWMPDVMWTETWSIIWNFFRDEYKTDVPEENWTYGDGY